MKTEIRIGDNERLHETIYYCTYPKKHHRRGLGAICEPMVMIMQTSLLPYRSKMSPGHIQSLSRIWEETQIVEPVHDNLEPQK